MKVYLLLLLLFISFVSTKNGPVQIVEPKSDHTQLFVVKENLDMLLSLENVVVVSVVGPYHSGKSFLLNQLMERTSGFELGPTVSPSTRGLWVWGEPLKRKIGDKEVNVIFIDTEGFYANNVSETYDAKIFSVSTLVSSCLLYNSVKIIDQASIEYLELLSRRTQLFSLKSRLASDSQTKALSDLIEFPTLFWVVQDFVQDLQGITATEWLKSLLNGYRRDTIDSNTQEKSELTNIFTAGVEAHTLFLPHSEREKLRHLDRATPEELSKDYREEMKRLRDRVLETALKSSRIMKGPELHSLINLLVNFANSGNYPTVPSAWSSFLQEQGKRSIDDSVRYYATRFAQIIASNAGWLNLNKFEETHKALEAEADQLLQKMLFGLKPEYHKSISTLKATLEKEKATISQKNDDVIREKFENAFNASLALFSEKFKITDLLSTENLKKFYNKTLQTSVEFYNQQIASYTASPNYNSYLKRLQKETDAIYQTTVNLNSENIKTKLQYAVSVATKKFQEGSAAPESPLSSRDVEEKHKTVSAQTWEEFDRLTKPLQTEDLYNVFKTNLENELKKLFDTFKKHNHDLVLAKCKSVNNELLTEKSQKIGTQKLPTTEDVIFKFKRQVKEETNNQYKLRLDAFSDTDSYKTVLDALNVALDEKFKTLQDLNINKTLEISRGPLTRCKTKVRELSPTYWMTWTFRAMVFNVCNEEIKDSIPDESVKREVIQRFIAQDLAHDLQGIVYRTRMIGVAVLAALAVVLYFGWKTFIATPDSTSS